MTTMTQTEEMVAKMSAYTARALRDKLDQTPANELPGADAVGPMRALRSYRVFMTLPAYRPD